METVHNEMPPMQPKNWLVESILVTIFCCMPFGIPGIVHAAQVNARFENGDYAGAEAASKKAGNWTKIGFFVGLSVIVLYGIFMLSMFKNVASMYRPQ